MQRRSFVSISICLLWVVALGTTQTAFGKPKGSYDPNGWVWGYTAKNASEEVSGTFRIANHEVFKDGQKVGTVVPHGGAGLGDKVDIILTNFGKINGKALLEKTKMNPPVWVGTLKAKDGKEWHLTTKLLSKQ